MSVSSIGAQTWSRWAAALAAFVLVLTAIAAGARYVVCLRTGATHLHACCAKRQAKAKERSPEPPRFVAGRSCCESREVPPSGASAVAHVPPALEANSVGLPQEAWDARAFTLVRGERQAEDWPIRAGPLCASERCAWLQVFLI